MSQVCYRLGMKKAKPRKRRMLDISDAAHVVLKKKADEEGRTMKKVLDMLCGV